MRQKLRHLSTHPRLLMPEVHIPGPKHHIGAYHINVPKAEGHCKVEHPVVLVAGEQTMYMYCLKCSSVRVRVSQFPDGHNLVLVKIAAIQHCFFFINRLSSTWNDYCTHAASSSTASSQSGGYCTKSTATALCGETANEQECPTVYSDGCCFNNGKAGARAGIGVYWGHNSPQ